MQPAPQIRRAFIRPGFDPFAGSAYLFDIDGTLLNTRDGVHWNAFRAALRQVFGIESLLDTVPVHGNTDIGILRAVTEQQGIPREDFEGRLPRALEIMGAEAERNRAGMQCELCPGIRELLTELRCREKLLGVVSGNLESIGWSKVTAAGLGEFFEFGSFSDDAEQRTEIFRRGLLRAREIFADREPESFAAVSHAGENARERLLAQDDSSRYRDERVVQSRTHQLTNSPNPPLGRALDCIFVGDTPADIAAAQALGVPVIAVATGIYDFAQLLASSPDACVPCCTDLLDRAMDTTWHS